MNVAVVLVYRLFPAAHMYLGDGNHIRYWKKMKIKQDVLHLTPPPPPPQKKKKQKKKRKIKNK